ncbi:efflux RND transporter periplasmic adaptor subunit [Thalassotalea euphylliae]|uniref:efflux RND transporter periplasmic adaptor subunit n=1 Tax=Thalassotalea euphylliae TaxID=1655234 RepID=UPI00363884A1
MSYFQSRGAIRISHILLICVGIGVGFLGNQYWNSHQHVMTSSDSESSEPQPLYWVAPMDPNYRRDKPGKSPMGMDLVPVYEESAQDDDAMVRIASHVVQNLGVKTHTMAMGTLMPNINTLGYVQYDEEKLQHVHPRLAGWIETLYVKAQGEYVDKDAPLYELYSPELVNAQEEYLLALNTGEQPLIKGAEGKLLALHVPQEAIKKLKQTRQVEQFVQFTAPQRGVIEHLNIREGYYVKPDMTMFSIGDLSSVWVEAEVLERQAPFVNVGASVTMSLDYLPGKTWQGKVDYIYPSLNMTNRTLRLRVRFDNANGELKPNMQAALSIESAHKAPVLLLPKQALIRTGKFNRAIVALDEGAYVAVPVTVTQNDDEYFAVASGLSAGDEVVIAGQFLLDSEASKTAAFERLLPGVDKSNAARVSGQVNNVDINTRIVNISRGAIEKWDRPPATMDFIVANQVDIKAFEAGKSLDFTFEIQQGEFVIVDTHRGVAP